MSNRYAILVHFPDDGTPGAKGFIGHVLRRQPGAVPLEHPRLADYYLATVPAEIIDLSVYSVATQAECQDQVVQGFPLRPMQVPQAGRCRLFLHLLHPRFLL